MHHLNLEFRPVKGFIRVSSHDLIGVWKHGQLSKKELNRVDCEEAHRVWVLGVRIRPFSKRLGKWRSRDSSWIHGFQRRTLFAHWRDQRGVFSKTKNGHLGVRVAAQETKEVVGNLLKEIKWKIGAKNWNWRVNSQKRRRTGGNSTEFCLNSLKRWLKRWKSVKKCPKNLNWP